MTAPRARLSLDLDVTTKENFEVLRERTGTGSLTDLIKKSVALFDVATAHTSSGGAIIFRYPDGREERLVLL
ncbi:MAG TPA: hypothetical protein VF388_02915 [Lacunisphaera sp.]